MANKKPNAYTAIVAAIEALEKELGSPNTMEVDQRISLTIKALEGIRPLF